MEELNSLSSIVKKVINEINDGKSKIFNILDGLKDEESRRNIELQIIKKKIEDIIEEVDELEKEDKRMRILLSNSSKDFKMDNENSKRIYEKALDVRVKYITKQNEERELRKKRDEIELTLRNSIKNISEADSMIKQINIALGYLQGDLMNNLEDVEEESKSLMGIKILEMLENERRRIARDVHDGPAQYIANTLMRIDFCRMLIQKDIQKGIEELDDLKINVKSSLKEIREILFDLRPIAIEEKGFSKSIKDMVSYIIDGDNIEMNIFIEEICFGDNYILQITLYRIIQEIVNNIKKHSEATKVIIEIKLIDKIINLSVRDNGKGFDLDKQLEKVKKEENSYGLIGIYDRVKQLQGEIEIKTKENSGTIYNIKLPFKEGEKRI